MRALKALATVLVLTWAANSWGAAEHWQDLPGSLELETVGDSLRMNGTPMLIRAFRSRQSSETLLREVEANWTLHPDHQPVHRNSIPNWIVLNQTIGERHRSFQVREQDGITQGFVAVTSPKETLEPTLIVRLPAQVQPMQVIDSVDAGRVSQQVIAVSQRSVDVTAAVFGQALKAQRWTTTMLKKQGDLVRLSANRGGEQFDAVLSAQKRGALIMINTTR
jgi:hypothetical protein